MKATLLASARAELGECALWCERRSALFWTDIEGRTVNRWREADASVRQWTLPERCGSFALCERTEQLLLGLASGIALFNLDTDAMTPVIPVEADNPVTRLNDGRCDVQGRFVFGTFNQAKDAAAIGHFYRVGADLRVERLPLPAVAVANSIAFSPDGRLMYFTDSWSREIWCVDYHADGRLGTPRLFVRIPKSEGFPDGSAVDAEGGLWNAQWAGGCVVRYAPDGSATLRVPLPASQVTCPAFGGAGLDRLFVTTARAGLDDAQLRAQPTAGDVFEVPVASRGLPEHRFRTDLRA
ncbi:MAG TPA: SMP-30/gluconolactonase/LRE family protein [Ramlibacter sp.]|uniref:SMP-30/gluconolactonase/LRE family protein n=1 Tax=Ramlibacter sp. TaxID=1917967 RepID=UPI002C48BE32|nr:SMP-30/gluconolactonase/LRE family protein [Ramlibacter sp.]HVZ45843.1 SMP-30/gluconolactonase/LRE family protein [Ramlibacter sp.]